MKGNLLVLGLVSGLLAASASQCGCKKRANGRGRSAASVGGWPEKVDTASKKVASVAGEMGSSVLVQNNENGPQYDERIENLLKEIGKLGKDLVAYD